MGAAFAVFPCVQQHFCALFSAVAQTPVMASAAVLLAVVASARGWLDGLALVLASDDDGPCGAAVLRRQWRGH